MENLPGYTCFPFSHGGTERLVYRKGTGPGVVVMHEVPGISAEVLRFADKVAGAGFTVFMPHLFGPLGRKTNPVDRMFQLARVCISREFNALAEDRSSPILSLIHI